MINKRTFALGDVHGNYKGLMQCLKRSGFNNEKDTLIQLGDVVDGFSESFECVEELLKIKNLISIRGNH
ncbi:MAG: metallophosphoesterase, partial [Paenisporosarcina sp.]